MNARVLGARGAFFRGLSSRGPSVGYTVNRLSVCQKLRIPHVKWPSSFDKNGDCVGNIFRVLRPHADPNVFYRMLQSFSALSVSHDMHASMQQDLNDYCRDEGVVGIYNDTFSFLSNEKKCVVLRRLLDKHRVVMVNDNLHFYLILKVLPDQKHVLVYNSHGREMELLLMEAVYEEVSKRSPFPGFPVSFHDVAPTIWDSVFLRFGVPLSQRDVAKPKSVISRYFKQFPSKQPRYFFSAVPIEHVSLISSRARTDRGPAAAIPAVWRFDNCVPEREVYVKDLWVCDSDVSFERRDRMVFTV